ncbi:MAG: I78 family peptidase inhibitor [Shimia sp.]
MRRLLLLPCAILALAACAVPDPRPASAEEATGAVESPPDGPIAGCTPDAPPALDGRRVADLDFAPGARVRILPPGAVGTTDFVPQRLNLLTDADGFIVGVSCG